jgi:dTDP-4-amino-4,6-dideoxygalactose transaminase
MRLDEVQSAFLRIKLKYLNKWTSQRQEIANWYYEQLNDLESLTLPHIHPCATHSFHLFVIRSKKRDLLQQHLLNNNISTLIHYPIPPHMQEAYFSLGHKKGDFPIAEKLSQECLSLPLWPGMTKNEVDYVCNTIKNFK